ncbi:peptidase C78 [Striga asiatica]|uniref:Peptidase C78 n=1 Tax=Striga asiatica TaxID=4170 RepID=A0A5A7RIY9_STRAF|nr:peptidase C78 [Striga asiatica]
MIPLIRQTPCFITTICESSGWRAFNSFRTSSMLALWSAVNCSATILFDPSKQPITALESPKLATNKIPFQMTPTKQHDPIAAIAETLKMSQLNLKKPIIIGGKELPIGL